MSASSILSKKGLDHAPGFIVFAFADVMITNASLSIDEVASATNTGPQTTAAFTFAGSLSKPNFGV